MELEEILKQTKAMIQEHAGGDPDKFFYANRYVFARLQLLERQEKVVIKKRLIESKAVCHGCGKPIESPKGVAVHRLDVEKAYSHENCVLMHRECHEKFHAENPSGKGGRRASSRCTDDSNPKKVLSKVSKRYDGHSFLYWWDITPNGAESLKEYDLIEFVRKDTNERCSIPTAALSGFLVEDRMTTRGEGNWGIRVLKERPDALAFEPGRNGKNWLFLPVVWEDDDEGEPQTSD